MLSKEPGCTRLAEGEHGNKSFRVQAEHATPGVANLNPPPHTALGEVSGTAIHNPITEASCDPRPGLTFTTMHDPGISAVAIVTYCMFCNLAELSLFLSIGALLVRAAKQGNTDFESRLSTHQIAVTQHRLTRARFPAPINISIPPKWTLCGIPLFVDITLLTSGTWIKASLLREDPLPVLVVSIHNRSISCE
ncbi:hypothetical protein KCU81_g402, partial [Aureobasidium melanogenum]